jgi:hypothetical protein
MQEAGAMIGVALRSSATRRTGFSGNEKAVPPMRHLDVKELGVEGFIVSGDLPPSSATYDPY